MSATVACFGGVVAQYTGDGVLVYFGWPQAHEHDAERAVRTGLALVDRVARQAWPFGVELAIRVGINSAQVLVGNVGSEVRFSYTVMGDGGNVAPARRREQAVRHLDLHQR